MHSKLFVLLLILIFFHSPVHAKSFGDFEGAVYVSNPDGDTIIFDLPGPHPLRLSIRINGIDTPEINGKCEKEKYDAQQAQQMVAGILRDAEQITLKNIEKGQYFELAADVYVDGNNLAGLLIVAGMAVKYDGERKTKNWCN